MALQLWHTFECILLNFKNTVSSVKVPLLCSIFFSLSVAYVDFTIVSCLYAHSLLRSTEYIVSPFLSICWFPLSFPTTPTILPFLTSKL